MNIIIYRIHNFIKYLHRSRAKLRFFNYLNTKMGKRLAATLFCVLFYFSLRNVVSSTQSPPPRIWAWKCMGEGEEGMCVKQRYVPDSGQSTLDECKLTCPKHGSLFPKPKNVLLGKTLVSFLPNNIRHTFSDCNRKICSLLTKAFRIFETTISKYHPTSKDGPVYWSGPWDSITQGNEVHIDFDVPGLSEYLSLKTDETYSLNVTNQGNNVYVNIKAPSFFGARHALETLSQLIIYDREKKSLQMISSAIIVDGPQFPYRGVSLDTARSFIPVKDIKRTLDGMSYNKLNTFHWHITDSQSFPLQLKSVPQMSQYGATSPEKVYSTDDVREIVEYARLRGIKVVPELDAPAHMGHGWNWGEEYGLGKLVVCLDKQPWPSYCAGPPCGQLNLANENIYDVLRKILKEMSEIFSPFDMFHYGGDEIFLNCWNSSTEVTDWMEMEGFGRSDSAFYKQWSIFQERVRQLFTEANNGVEIPGVLWTSTLTDPERIESYLGSQKYIIQIWTTADDASIGELLKKGYNVIFSNYDALYLDCGFGSWVGKGNNWCSPYKGWQAIYSNDIVNISNTLAGAANYNRNQILGAEVALWTEQADEHSLDNRLWPRASAHAERVWSNPETDYSKAESRLLEHSERMMQRGLAVERIQPVWCRQNAGACRDPNLDNAVETLPGQH